MQKLPIENKGTLRSVENQYSTDIYSTPEISPFIIDDPTTLYDEREYIVCYSCEAIRQQIEKNLSPAPFAVNGYEYIKVVENLNYKEYAPEKIETILKMGFEELHTGLWCRECGSAVNAKLYMKEYDDKIELSFTHNAGDKQVDKLIIKLPAQVSIISTTSLSSIGDLIIYNNFEQIDQISFIPTSLNSYELYKDVTLIGSLILNPNMNELTLSLIKDGDTYNNNTTYSLFIYKNLINNLDSVNVYSVIQAATFNNGSMNDILINSYVGYIKLYTYNLVYEPENEWDQNWPVIETNNDDDGNGDDTTVGIKNVFAWGANSFGQLGDGSINNTKIPALNLSADIIKISAGKYHTTSIDINNYIWSWGRNDNGQLGLNFKDNSHHSFPTKIIDLNNVIDISNGWFHSAALQNDGSVWCWGGNYKSQLGDGTTVEKIKPIQVKSSESSYLNNIKSISAGSEFTIALDNVGNVLKWGDNELFPKNVENLTNVIEISAGSWHSLALKDDGTVWSFGYDWSGQLGIGFNDYSDSINSDGEYYKAVPVQGLTNIVKIVCGAEHSIALKDDGTIWVWGNNEKGQLGIGTNKNKHYPVKIQTLSQVSDIASGEYHSFAILNDETVWTWGDNTYGQLGLNNIESQNLPVQISLLSEITNIYGGLTCSFAIKNN